MYLYYLLYRWCLLEIPNHGPYLEVGPTGLRKVQPNVYVIITVFLKRQTVKIQEMNHFHICVFFTTSRIVDGVEDSSNQYKANRFDFPGPCHQQASRHHSLTSAPRQRLINHYNSGMRQSFTSPQLARGINCKYLLWT